MVPGEGSLAAFTLGDVVCPEAGTALTHVGPDLRVVGRVVYFSDCGEWKDHFAVVEVGGLATPVIVPAHRLQTLLPAGVVDEDAAKVALIPGQNVEFCLARRAANPMESVI